MYVCMYVYAYVTLYDSFFYSTCIQVPGACECRPIYAPHSSGTPSLLRSLASDLRSLASDLRSLASDLKSIRPHTLVARTCCIHIHASSLRPHTLVA